MTVEEKDEVGAKADDSSGDKSDDTVVEKKDGEGGGDSAPVKKEESKVYEFGGRQMTADELYESARELQADHTTKAQKLAELEKSGAPKKEEDKFDPEDEKVANDLFKILKAKGMVMTKEEFEERREMDTLERSFKSLEEKYKGSDDLPKFNTDRVVDFMKKNGYPPHHAERAFRDMHEKEFLADAIKKAKDGQGGYKTETQKGTAKKTSQEKTLETKEDVEKYVIDELGKMNAGEDV